jgi:hypothetical protein
MYFFFYPQHGSKLQLIPKEKLLDFSRSFLVAGTGLEPVTFGL